MRTILTLPRRGMRTVACMSQDGDIYADDQLSRGTALAGSEGDVDDELDRGYSPPEKLSGNMRHGTTTAEVLRGESFDERLQQEVPEADPYEVAAAEDVADIDDIDDGEVGDERAGRLVDPDQGGGADLEASLVADDVGIDGAAAGAEEAAMHVVPEGDELL